jgi:Na+/H+-dicarboxylate symporter
MLPEALDLQTQLMIVVTATLASIGSAAVPSAGMVMLVIVLGQAGIPEAGLALILRSMAIRYVQDCCQCYKRLYDSYDCAKSENLKL